MPQSQTAANPRHKEEEKKDKNIRAQNKQTNVRVAQRPASSSPSEMNAKTNGETRTSTSLRTLYKIVWN